MRSALARLAARGLRTSAAAPALAAVALPDGDALLGAASHATPTGLSPHQQFAAHTMAHVGSGSDNFDMDEVAAQLHQTLRAHVEAAFSTTAVKPTAVAAAATAAAASAPPRLRDSARSVAARLSTQVGCRVEEGTPWTVDGAMQPSPQARVIAEAAAPHRLVWANPAFEALSGLRWDELSNAPCLDVVRGPAASAARLEGLHEALAAHARGTATLAYGTADAPVPVKVTATPLVGRDGSSSRMLLVFTPRCS